MKRLSSIVVALLLGGCLVGREGRMAGGEADFTLNLPAVLPPLVVIQPGVSVVSDLDDEVYYTGGYYWARQGDHWYRSADHRRGWARVERRHVPGPIAQEPPGRYRRYHGGEQRPGGQHDRDGRGGDPH